MDLFVVPTLAFNLLYGFIIVRLGRRELVWIGVTNSPTADWIARQITEAFPWDSAPAAPNPMQGKLPMHLPMRDGLTQVKDFPKEFAGSGQVIAE